jgi:DNA-binding MarR family transcriptional regulator
VPPSEHDYDQRILQAIASGERVTQRSLAGQLGVALGLTNLLIRRLVAKGYVKMAGLGTRHVRYLMTPAGWEALGRATRLSLENTLHLYTQTREQIRGGLLAISRDCAGGAEGHKTVVFYGAGDVAEIAYVSLQGTDLTLIGVIDDHKRGRFFGLAITGPERLRGELFEGRMFGRLIVTSLRHAETIRQRARACGVPDARVCGIAATSAGPAAHPMDIPSTGRSLR